MSATSWKYLGLAMAPIMVIALPTQEYPEDAPAAAQLERRFMPSLEGDGPVKKAPSKLQDVESADEGEASNDDEKKATPTAARNATTTTITTPPETADTKMTTLPVERQTAAEETREHWMIAVGSIVAFIAICVLCFGLWKWRASVAAKVSRRRAKKRPQDPEKEQAITAPVNSKRSAEPPMSERVRSLFGTSTTVTGRNAHDMPQPPPPALAPSSVGLDMQARRQIVRTTLLNQGDRKRSTGNGGSQTFYLDDERNSASPAPRKTKRESLSLTIDVFGNPTFAALAVPDSPEAAKANTRYSWVAPPPEDAPSLPRSSLESQPQRFRSINSWVSQQTNLTAMKTTVGSRGSGDDSAPSTPVEFRHHPGSPAEFLSENSRVDSRVLDLRIEALL